MLRHMETGKLLPNGVVSMRVIDACRKLCSRAGGPTPCVEKGYYCTECLATGANISVAEAKAAIDNGVV